MDRVVVVKFHTNIANRWLFMIQRKIMAIILYSQSYLDMYRGGRFFSRYGAYDKNSRQQQEQNKTINKTYELESLKTPVQ